MRERRVSVAANFNTRGAAGLGCAVLVAAIFASGPTNTASAAEFGSSPYPKGFSDIFSGIVPTEPGLYALNDLYHYDGNVGATVFNGAVQLGVEAKFTADFLTLTYVTKWKVLGGTYAFGVAPSVMSMDTNVGLSLPSFTGRRGRTFGPFTFNFGDTDTAVGDTGFTPAVIGWHSGKFFLECRRERPCADTRLQHQQPGEHQSQSLVSVSDFRDHLLGPKVRLAGPAMKIVAEFEQSLKKYPPTRPGPLTPTRLREPRNKLIICLWVMHVEILDEGWPSPSHNLMSASGT